MGSGLFGLGGNTCTVCNDGPDFLMVFSQSPAVSAVPTSRNSMAGKVCEKIFEPQAWDPLGLEEREEGGRRGR